MKDDKCQVCNGLGDYPIIDQFGCERYSIRCPECFGSGKAPEPEPEPEYEHLSSTAARITSVEALREWQRREREAP